MKELKENLQAWCESKGMEESTIAVLQSYVDLAHTHGEMASLLNRMKKDTEQPRLKTWQEEH